MTKSERDHKWRLEHPEKTCEYQRKWRLKNPEKARECWRKYQEANREKRNERKRQKRQENPEATHAADRKWRTENPESMRKATRKYLSAHREYVREKKREWRLANLEAARERERKWGASNPDKLRNQWSNRSARKRGATGGYTLKDIADLFDRQRGKCAACKDRITKTGSTKYHIDHVIPLKRGGSNWPDNLQLLCKPCNLKKGSMSPEEWAAQHGMLFC